MRVVLPGEGTQKETNEGLIPTCIQSGNLSYVALGPGSQNQIVSLNASWYEDEGMFSSHSCKRFKALVATMPLRPSVGPVGG